MILVSNGGISSQPFIHGTDSEQQRIPLDLEDDGAAEEPPLPAASPEGSPLPYGDHVPTSSSRSLVIESEAASLDLPGKLGRNNTVSGGERTAARQFMLSRLGGRITKETDGEQASGGEEFAAPFPTPKRKRRRSRRGSAGTHTGVSDSEFLSTSPTTPAVPPTPLPPTLDDLPDFRGTSVTPNQAASPRNPSPERVSEFPHPVTTRENAVEQERPEPTRRRSVVVEEEEEEHSLPLQSRYLGLPNTPERSPAQVDPLRLPHTSNAPSNASTDSVSASAIGVPVYLSQRPSPRHELFPSSPFTTPLKERPSRDEDEEEVLYPADTYRPRTPYDDHEREFSWVASPGELLLDL
jgi:serine/arginine repetitive matrix protein 2